MIILFEGPDRVGKGTQIQKLIHLLHDRSVQQLHYSSVKGFEDPHDAKDYSVRMYQDMFMILNQNYNRMHFVLDRSHIGDYVYGPMYRNYNGGYIFLLENYWREYKEFWDNFYLITLVDDPENLVKRDDGLSFSNELEKKKKEIELFVEATRKSYIHNKLVLSIKDKNIEEVFKDVRSFLHV